MGSLNRHLVRRDDGLALLFTPPFDKTEHDPGYIKGYPPGLRENGGQYTHAALWAVMAHAKLGQTDRAAGLFALLNPINHARTPAEVGRYKVEPYVVAADVYSATSHVGRGGWTWYTGSAGWMYRAGIESILGLQQRGDRLRIAPCIPSDWPGFELTVRQGKTRYHIVVENRSRSSGTVSQAELDGQTLVLTAGLDVPLDGGEHRLRVVC